NLPFRISFVLPSTLPLRENPTPHVSTYYSPTSLVFRMTALTDKLNVIIVPSAFSLPTFANRRSTKPTARMPGLPVSLLWGDALDFLEPLRPTTPVTSSP